METIDFNTVIAENISVVEGLIGVVSTEKNGLVSKDSFSVDRGELGTSFDYNNITQQGHYTARNATDTTNGPGYNFGILDVWTTSYNQIVQMFYPADGDESSRPKYRHRTSTGTWKSWKEL